MKELAGVFRSDLERYFLCKLILLRYAFITSNHYVILLDVNRFLINKMIVANVMCAFLLH